MWVVSAGVKDETYPRISGALVTARRKIPVNAHSWGRAVAMRNTATQLL
jgi:hypothetical protein